MVFRRPNYPSVKTLSRITDNPSLLRKVLEAGSEHDLRELVQSNPSLFKGTLNWLPQLYNAPSFHTFKMKAADDLCRTYGIESMPKGHNAKSPAFQYLNAGDTYAVTLLWVNGRYRVGCWGDIVERGNYD